MNQPMLIRISRSLVATNDDINGVYKRVDVVNINAKTCDMKNYDYTTYKPTG